MQGSGQWSSTYDALERFELAPSRRLACGYLLVMLGASVVLVPGLPRHFEAVALTLLLIALTAVGWRMLMAPRCLMYLGEGGWALQEPHRPPARVSIRVLLLHPACSIVVLGPRMHRYLVFGSDACPARQHRRLRRRLSLESS